MGWWKASRVIAAGFFLMIQAVAARADTVEDLYQGRSIVTGQENLAERARGIAEALELVLIKVSGDTRLPDDPRQARVLDRAAEYVTSLAYQDRLAGKKLMDEQGTRERSYFLTVTFDQAKVDAALAGLDRRPWGRERPRLLAVFGIRDTLGAYVLGTASDRGYGQRETLLAQANRRGLPLVLPRMDAIERQQITYADVAAGAGPALDHLRADRDAQALLSGTMTLESDGLWTTEVWLSHASATRHWRREHTSFDRALNDGLDRAARILAGYEDNDSRR